MINLSQFFEVEEQRKTLYFPNVAHQTERLKSVLQTQVATRQIQDLVIDQGNLKGVTYIVFSKTLGRQDQALIAIHIQAYGSRDLAIDWRYFERSGTAARNQLVKGTGKSLGATLLLPFTRKVGWWTILGGLWQVFSANPTQPLPAGKHAEAVPFVRAIEASLQEAIQQVS